MIVFLWHDSPCESLHKQDTTVSLKTKLTTNCSVVAMNSRNRYEIIGLCKISHFMTVLIYNNNQSTNIFRSILVLVRSK